MSITVSVASAFALVGYMFGVEGALVGAVIGLVVGVLIDRRCL